jgi:hypothetical protein
MLATPMTTHQACRGLAARHHPSGCAVGPDMLPRRLNSRPSRLDAVTRRHTTTPAPQLDRWRSSTNYERNQTMTDSQDAVLPAFTEHRVQHAYVARMVHAGEWS